MMRKHLTTFICLSIVGVINFYSFFEFFNTSSHLENHYLHQLFTGFMSLLFLLVYFKNQLLQKTNVSSRLKIFVVVFLFIFTFIHLAPARLIFAYHHQSQTQDGSHHPCCLPQVNNAVASFAIESLPNKYSWSIDIKQEELHLSLNSIQNKSPPLFS